MSSEASIEPNESILSDVKDALGAGPDYGVYDKTIMIHINSALSELYQLGVGDSQFKLHDGTEKWDDLLVGEDNLEDAKTFIVLKTKLYFDPPSSSFVLSAMERQIAELEWRINVEVDPGKEGI